MRSWVRFISVGMMLVCVQGCGLFPREAPRQVHVSRFMGRYLLTQDEETVAMVGLNIPRFSEANYNKESFQYAETLLSGKDVEIRTVEKKQKVGYPVVDLVEVFLDGRHINKHLLESGHAFFNEDYWNKKEKRIYRTLEQEAKEQGLGMWAHKENLKVLFIRHKNGRHAHYPDCSFVEEIKPEDRVEYYTHLPWTIFATRFAYHCYFCKERYETEKQEAKERQEKLVKMLKTLRVTRKIADVKTVMGKRKSVNWYRVRGGQVEGK